jgi:hypothetical protein
VQQHQAPQHALAQYLLLMMMRRAVLLAVLCPVV